MGTPALDLLLTGYFHEDCMEDFGDERGVVEAFMSMEPELAPLLVTEIDAVLAEFPNDSELATFVHAFKSPWGPAEGQSRAWLTTVRAHAVAFSRDPDAHP